MPQPKKAARFGGSPAHHKMILANLTTELIRHGRIRTTQAKAKTVQPLAERMITLAKRGDLHSRRQALRVIRDRDVVHRLFTHVGPAFAERDGGYTRVLKLGPRKGDAAPMALIELVDDVHAPAEDSADTDSRRRWGLRRQSRQAAEPGGAAASAQATAEAPAQQEEDGLQADPSEVEARLAAEDEAAGDEPVAGPVSADDQDAPAPERPADEGETTPVEDADPEDEDSKE